MQTRTILAAFAAILLSACATFFDSSPGTQLGSTWDGPPSVPIAQHIWEVDTLDNVRARCDFKYHHPYMACAIRLYGHPDGPRCLVISNTREQDAKGIWMRTLTGGAMESLWAHEVENHCRRGLNHRTQPAR